MNRTTATAGTKDLIQVIVKNRLGTRFTIVCDPSDTIRDFKKLVAAHTGIKADTILLKRQGVRAFRGDLTLEDYEIKNGSCLDLEIDTTD